jgi:cation channel sperm-associated protein 2
MMSIFQILTFDDWYTMTKELSASVNAVVSQIYILSWIFLGAFIFRNIFVGVIGTLLPTTI